MIEEKLICLEMDDVSGRDKGKGRWAKLEDYVYYRDFLRDIGAFVTIAIEPQNASGQVMKFLSENREQFLPTVHGTNKYGHYGGVKREWQLREQWEWSVKKIQEYGFDMGLDGNRIFIPPMHMISDAAIDVLHNYGVKVIGSSSNNFPLGSKEVRNSKGEVVYRLAENIQAYTQYRGVHFYKRFRPWMLSAGIYNLEGIMDGIYKIKEVSKRSQFINGSYNRFLALCVRDFKEKCLDGDSIFYAHEINIGGERPFMQILEIIASNWLFDNVRFVDAKEFTSKYITI